MVTSPHSKTSLRSESAHEHGVRERIMETAARLFYQEGIQAVGIQRLIDEAGIAKASLYAHFASKDDLVAAYLEEQHTHARAEVETWLATTTDPRAKLLRLFDMQIEKIEQPDFRGCAYCNVKAEVTASKHPASAVLRVHRTWLRELVGGLVREAGIASPTRATSVLLLLLDGTMANVTIDGDPRVGRHARWAAEQLIKQ